ncbi:MAG TPA: A/G-specific adenine glycosylase [Candidatus Acidoferrum sp.]|nr:A/G-specific adenine glycosylase [Candidatus Acidoferrum sp.]
MTRDDKEDGVNTQGLARIVAPLLYWYRQNARALPWRESADPYRVWISEIMLQQTRVETVIPYYGRFVEAVPDLKTLAELEEERLLKLWEGLGYYSRAKSLQKAAKAIMEKFGGTFPRNVDDIRLLPGIGDYTAGAIASICFGQPTPAVDGNVLRVVSRLVGCADDIAAPGVKAGFAAMLAEIYPDKGAGDFTQSLMELGAVVCLPRGRARCEVCPLAALCAANAAGTQSALPVKTGRAPRKKEQKTVFLLRCGELVAVRRRDRPALLGGLWEFPNVEGHLTAKEAEDLLLQWGVAPLSLTCGMRKKHVFTHIEWEMTSYVAVCKEVPDDFTWVTKAELTEKLALPTAFGAFLHLV